MKQLPRKTAAFHLVSEFHVLGVDVELPLPLSQHPCQDRPRVDTHPHIHRRVGGLLYVPNINNHIILFCFLRFLNRLLMYNHRIKTQNYLFSVQYNQRDKNTYPPIKLGTTSEICSSLWVRTMFKLYLDLWIQFNPYSQKKYEFEFVQ